ncbi:hypothetical protein KUTeg_008435 [Tegillarca granosa]|uniref:Uncharacterized protein n=1 Tax=Tegillarca granosa TaxID=220873 RepID=A0ABQ9F963_TEGGR|nr:hypothetical protein KUTeg_008435 [Tegillarca granosa]
MYNKYYTIVTVLIWVTFSDYLDVGVDVSITIKNISESDDGRYICLLLKNADDAEVRTTDLKLIVPGDPRVNCEPVSVVQINSDRVFKCSVQVDKGPVKCSYVYWEVNQTYLESSLTLKNTASNSFSKTYIIVYRGSPHHNTVRKEAQLDTDSNSKSRTESCVSLVFGPLLIAILTLWY